MNRLLRALKGAVTINLWNDGKPIRTQAITKSMTVRKKISLPKGYKETNAAIMEDTMKNLEDYIEEEVVKDMIQNGQLQVEVEALNTEDKPRDYDNVEIVVRAHFVQVKEA